MLESFNLVEFLRLILSWKKPILIVSTIAVVGTIIITDPHIMPPYYKSECIIYASNPELTSASNLFSSSEATMFGGTSDADRILQIAMSSPLELYVVHKFHLFQHYKIDSAKESYPNDAVLTEFKNNYSVIRNERGAIEITVEDQDKQLAATMANEVANHIDQIYKDVMNGNKEKILDIYQQKINDNQKKIRKLTDSILALKTKYNFFDGINRMASNINVAGNDSFQKAYEAIKMLEAQEQFTIKDLNNSLTDFSQYEASINKNVPSIYVVEAATPAERKSRPMRTLSAIGAFILASLLTAIFLLLINKYKALKAALKND